MKTKVWWYNSFVETLFDIYHRMQIVHRAKFAEMKHIIWEKLYIYETQWTKKKSSFKFVYEWPPSKVFLADALGALLTSSTLGIFLVQLREYFLLSKNTFYILAAYVFVLFIYSFSIYLAKPTKWVPFLRIISLANAAYCLFTFTIIFLLSQTVSTLTIIYFVGEAGLILTIAYVEWTYANKNSVRLFSKA